MTFSIRKKLVILSFLLITVILVDFLIIKEAIKATADLLLRVEHSQNVILVSEQLLGHLKNAETGQRGYLLTGEWNYLDPHYDGVRLSKKYFTDLLSLTSDDPSQNEILHQLDPLIEQKIDELSETISYFKEGDANKALQIVKEGSGQDLMDQIRILLDKFQGVERELLIQRSATFYKSQQQLELIFMAEVAIFLTMVILFLLYIQNTIIKPLEVLAQDAKRAQSTAKQLFNHPFSGSSDEIGILTNALAFMHQQNINRTTKLEEISENLAQEKDKAILASMTDPLTLLFNRRKFLDILPAELKRLSRDKSNIALCMIDIDYFKRYNDEYGHQAGDYVLATIAKLLKEVMRRPTDYTFRLGGEEFCLLFSDLEPDDALALAKNIREKIEDLNIPHAKSKVSDWITVSIGLINVNMANHDFDMEKAYKLADDVLYKAKNAGRNRVEIIEYR